MEKDCEYVSIRGIAQNCDHFPKNIVSDTTLFNPNDYINIKENETVFVITSVLKHFVRLILPNINFKFKLVTGACVIGVPNEISITDSINYISLFNNIQWYTQNFDGIYECIPIPLGIDYHTLQRENHAWGSKASALSQETDIKNITKLSDNFENRKTRTLSTFHFRLFERHNRDRYIAIQHLNNVKFNDVIKNPIPRNDLWKLMSKYKFIISPHGNGLDCHRTYESILIGSIPIVKSSSLDCLYTDMPVLIVKDWSKLTEEMLNNFKTEFSLEKLKLQYWIDLIKRDI